MNTVKPIGKTVGKILLVLGILAALYFFVAKPAIEKKKALPSVETKDSVNQQMDSTVVPDPVPLTPVTKPQPKRTAPTTKPVAPTPKKEPKKEPVKEKKKGKERENLDVNF